jgi:MFS family permease
VTSYSIILSEFANRKEVGLAYLSAARGLGFLGGPLSGQLFYSFFGYQYTFLIFAGIMTLTLLYSWVKLPSSLNINASTSKAAQRATARLSQM